MIEEKYGIFTFPRSYAEITNSRLKMLIFTWEFSRAYLYDFQIAIFRETLKITAHQLFIQCAFMLIS